MIRCLMDPHLWHLVLSSLIDAFFIYIYQTKSFHYFSRFQVFPKHMYGLRTRPNNRAFTGPCAPRMLLIFILQCISAHEKFSFSVSATRAKLKTIYMFAFFVFCESLSSTTRVLVRSFT